MTCSSENVKLSGEHEKLLETRRNKVKNSTLRGKLMEVRCSIADIDDRIRVKKAHIGNLAVEIAQLHGRKFY